jgi:alanyl-tRNA synthetase
MKLSFCFALLASSALLLTQSAIANPGNGKKKVAKYKKKKGQTNPETKKMIQKLHKKLGSLNRDLSTMKQSLAQSKQELVTEKQKHDQMIQSYSIMMQEFEKLTAEKRQQVIATVESKGLSWEKNVLYGAGTFLGAAALYFGLKAGAGIDLIEKMKEVGSTVTNYATKKQQ